MSQKPTSRIAWFNGAYMPETQVMISLRDRGWKYGDGVFDMTRTFDGRAFRMKEHVERLYRSLWYLRLDPGMSPQEMIDAAGGAAEFGGVGAGEDLHFLDGFGGS